MEAHHERCGKRQGRESPLISQTAASPTFSLQEAGRKIISKGSSAATSFTQALKPKANTFAQWCKHNKGKLAAGAGVLLLACFLWWLIPRLFGTPVIEFQTYKIHRTIITKSGMSAGVDMIIDVPKGDDLTAQLVTEGLKQFIHESEISEVVNEEPQGTLPDIAEAYAAKFLEYAEEEEENSSYVLTISHGYQNETSITFHVTDWLDNEGKESDITIRLSDGHLMKQEEMIKIPDSNLQAILQTYLPDNLKDMELWDNYCFSPAPEGSNLLIQTGSHLYENVFIPLEAIEPYLTEGGREIFIADPVSPTDLTKEDALEVQNAATTTTDNASTAPSEGESAGTSSDQPAQLNTELLGTWRENTENYTELYLTELVLTFEGKASRGTIKKYIEFEERYTYNITDLIPDGKDIRLQYEKYTYDYGEIGEDNPSGGSTFLGRGTATVTGIGNGRVKLISNDSEINGTILQRANDY